jgi:hypothetical protein
VKPGRISALQKHKSIALEAHPNQFKCSSYWRVRATALQDNVGDIHIDFVPSESTVTTGYSSLWNERVRKSITRKDQGFWQGSFLSKAVSGLMHPLNNSNYSYSSGKFCNSLLIPRDNHVWSNEEINVKPDVSTSSSSSNRMILHSLPT